MRIIKQVMNVFTLVFLIGILMLLTGDLASERIAKMDYMNAAFAFTIYVIVADIIKWIIGWAGDKIGAPFLGRTLRFNVFGLPFEIIILILVILLLPLTGDIAA